MFDEQMKIVLVGIAIFVAISALVVMLMGDYNGVKKVCIDNVEYASKNNTGLTVLYNPDGTVKVCDTKD